MALQSLEEDKISNWLETENEDVDGDEDGDEDDDRDEDDDECQTEDDRINTKLSSMRITRLKLVKLQPERSDDPDEDKRLHGSADFNEPEPMDTDDLDDSDQSALSAKSSKEYIDKLVALLRKRYTIVDKNVSRNIHTSLRNLQGNFLLKIMSHRRTIESKMTKLINSFTDTENEEESHRLGTEQEDYMIFLVKELRGTGDDQLVKYAEIFVLTSGNAYQLFEKSIRDDTFPTKIARRLLKFSLKTLSSKPLTGPHASQALIYRPDEGTCLTFWDYLGHITSSYKMTLRADSSLYRLSCFRTKNGKPKMVSMTVGEDYLKLHQSKSLRHIALVLLHLSRICRGQKTFKYGGDDREKDDEKFDVFNHVTVMKGKTFKENQNKVLKKKLKDCFENSKKKVGMLLTHKNLEKWHKANQFVLKTKTGKKKLETWKGDPPSIDDMFKVVRKTLPSDSQFDVDNLSLQFQDTSDENSKPIIAPLLKLVEGHFITPSGESLFRYCGEWLKIKTEYMTQLEMEFSNIMTHCHLPPDIVLPLSWPYSGVDAPTSIHVKDKKATRRQSTSTTNEKFKKWYMLVCRRNYKHTTSYIPPHEVVFDEYLQEESKRSKKAKRIFMRMHCHQGEEHYNEGYILYSDILEDTNSGYLLGDRILMKNVELFDILYYTPDKTYLIHVKEGFGNSTRDACSQIRVSAEFVFRNMICNNNFDILEEFWKTVTSLREFTEQESKYRSRVRECYRNLGKNSFIKLFQRNEIIFVFAFRDKGKVERLVVPFVLYPEKRLRRVFKDDTKVVTQELMRCKYLKRSGQKVIITDKAMNTTLEEAEKEIQLKTQALARTACCILKQTMSNHKSYIAKMEVVHLFSHFRQFRTPEKSLSLKLCSISKSLPGSSD